MHMSQYEIEVKTLLGEKANSDALKNRMSELDPACACTGTNVQLNHYFEGGDLATLYEKTENLFIPEIREKFKQIAEKGKQFSVRTRKKDDSVLLVVKASIDSDSSSNGVTRLEFEELVPVSLEELDALVEEAGFTYQAKWSREREEYNYKGANVCIDKNAGYGYLAEFEKVVHGDDETALKEVRKEIDALMEELGVSELPQDRLERMFAFYNANWPEYYGTNKTFIIE